MLSFISKLYMNTIQLHKQFSYINKFLFWKKIIPKILRKIKNISSSSLSSVCDYLGSFVRINFFLLPPVYLSCRSCRSTFACASLALKLVDRVLFLEVKNINNILAVAVITNQTYIPCDIDFLPWIDNILPNFL